MIRHRNPTREPWIKPHKRVDLSRMSSTVESRRRAARLVLLGCAACGKVPAQIHHIRDGHGMSERAPWWETIPLCHEHHNGSPMSTHGAKRREFHEKHGSERDMLAVINQQLPAELLGLR